MNFYSPLPITSVTLAGEFGRRVRQIIDKNILQIDVNETFLASFRTRGEGGLMGIGNFLDACIRLAANTRDERIIALKTRVIADLLATQDPDGYIGTVLKPESRIVALWDLHENAYIIWALISDFDLHHETASLVAAQKMADYMLGLFAKNPDLRPDTLGGVVTFWGSNLAFDRALIALSRASKNPKYRDFAINFMHVKEFAPEIHTGPSSLANHAYTYLGHALAQLDLYRESPDPKLLATTHKAIDFLRKKDGMLITGSCSEAECWHDTQSGLQNTSETCLSAYLARIMDAMIQIEANSLYGDIMERDVYNALFAATSPDGSKSRYFTPFDGPREYDANINRFCCANNNKRFLADLATWIYYQTPTGLAINLYNASSANIRLPGDLAVKIEQQTDYPTSGSIGIKVDPARPARFSLTLRIPRWAQAATVAINGGAAETLRAGIFHTIERTWNPGDTVQLELPMSFRLIKGRRAQAGRAAILRGPVIFTLSPERNPDFAKDPKFAPRELMIHPHEVQPPTPDDSIRPGGLSCTVGAWEPGVHHFWPHIQRKPLMLTEYPDATGQNIFFIVPNPESTALVEDELITD